jgi:hypothetical protein
MLFNIGSVVIGKSIAYNRYTTHVVEESIHFSESFITTNT